MRFCQVLHSIDDEYDGDFLPWLERKAGVEISSVLSIGKSVYGRLLYTSLLQILISHNYACF